MPIKFRCAFCNQLMGIARRKAGTVVSCPTCHGQVVVPTPPPPVPPVELPPAGAGAGGVKHNVFDRQDFNPALFNPHPAGAIPNIPPAPSDEFDVQPVPLPSSGSGKRLAATKLSWKTLLWLIIGAVLLAALAFAAGFAVARLE